MVFTYSLVVSQSLYGNTILVGGNSLLPGFTERMTRELNMNTPPVSHAAQSSALHGLCVTPRTSVSEGSFTLPVAAVTRVPTCAVHNSSGGLDWDGNVLTPVTFSHLVPPFPAICVSPFLTYFSPLTLVPLPPPCLSFPLPSSLPLSLFRV